MTAADTSSKKAAPSKGAVLPLSALTKTNPQDWFLVFKARYGMEVVFEELAARVKSSQAQSGQVATQVFTCCTAVAPILSAGLTPCYLDVDPAHLALNAAGVKKLANAPLAVVDQHTMGIIDAPQSRALAAAAHERGAILVEDCAHSVGRMARDGQGEPLADISIHSFGLEKLLPSTRFGGAVWVNPNMRDRDLCQRIAGRLGALPPIGARLNKAAKNYINQTRLLNHLPSAAAQHLTHHWVKTGAREPSITNEELKGRLPLPPLAPSAWIDEVAAQDLAHLGQNQATRRAAVEVFADHLTDVAGIEVPQSVAKGEPAQPLLRFPIFLGDEAHALAARQAVNRLGLYCVAWYRPLLFPGVDEVAYGVEDFSRWPISQRLSRGAVSLPTDISPERAASVVKAVLGCL